MTYQRLRRLALLAVIVSGSISYARADGLYRWIDSEGQMHFGDQPPPVDAQQADQIRMPSYTPPQQSADEQPYSILNQLKRMEEYRENLARERNERRQKEREYYLRKRELELREQAAEESPPSGSVYGYSLPVHPRHPYHGIGRPGYRPRPPGLWEPDHPAYRPYPRPPVARPHRPPVSGGVIHLGR